MAFILGKPWCNIFRVATYWISDAISIAHAHFSGYTLRQ